MITLQDDISKVVGEYGKFQVASLLIPSLQVKFLFPITRRGQNNESAIEVSAFFLWMLPRASIAIWATLGLDGCSADGTILSPFSTLGMVLEIREIKYESKSVP